MAKAKPKKKAPPKKPMTLREKIKARHDRLNSVMRDGTTPDLIKRV